MKVRYMIALPLLALLSTQVYAGDITAHYLGTGATYWNLPDTGQTTSYQTGDDATHNPSDSQLSYTDNGDGTVTDNRTDLMWAADGNGTGCFSGEATDWVSAINWAEGLDFAGYTDWRLPNMKELFSLIKFEGDNGPYIDDTYFPNPASSIYWTSTTYAPDAGSAMVVTFNLGTVFYYDKTKEYRVRAVRGGP